MTTMDVKGVSWVGHMCQRFEALCVDVDEAIYEDTFIYVGNQMRTVGESVKKFYSEVVQDLLSSSSLDSAKGKDAVITGENSEDAMACKKQKLDSESESANTASEKTGNSSDVTAMVKNSVSHDPCSSAQEPSSPVKFQSQFTDLVSNKCLPVVSSLNKGQEQEAQLKSFSDLSSKDSVNEFACNESCNERDEVLCGCGDTGLIEASPANMLASNDDKVQISWDTVEESAGASVVEGNQTKESCSKLDNSESSMKAALDTTITNNVQDAVEVDTLFSVSDTETLRCWLDLETRTASIGKQESLKLEESCVLVENDGHFSTLENVQKSYKKKFRGVFSPRKWAKQKRDQDQLVGKHNQQVRKSSGLAGMSVTESQNSLTYESLDSEWELL